MKEGSDQSRVLMAAALSLLVIIGWSFFYKPPPQPQQGPPAPVNALTAATAPAPAVNPPVAAAPVVAVHAAAGENSVVVESPLYRVEIWNRGGVVRSWQLRKFTDDNSPPQTLDLVHTDTARQEDAWPLSVALSDPQLEAAANSGFYVINTGGAAASGVLEAPVELELVWSDGHLAVTKHLKFGADYIVEADLSVSKDGQQIPAGLAWRGGFGDPTVHIGYRRGALPVTVFYSQATKLSTLVVKNLGQPKQPNVRATLPGPYDFVGIEDQYFAAAFLPTLNSSGGFTPDLTLTHWATNLDVPQGDKVATEAISEVAAGTTGSAPLAVRIYVGPKSLDPLKAVQPPLNELLNFGWLTVLSEPLFYALRWVHRYVPDWGWAIVVLTILINMLFYPLKTKQMRSAQKMQKVAPEVKAIQEKYKKYGMRDPRKQKMNEEVMALYSREGINPLGSCWPMLIQFPFWFAFYRVLAYTIDLRHAPWLLFHFHLLHDLSAPDPHYILPALYGLTAYLMQKMTPTPQVDPAQQRMMSIMPVMFSVFFIFYPAGLALYIVTSNLVGMAQQWYLNRTMPAPVKGRGKGPKKN
ncbi:MAG: membrane protein insertase YidC [Candidatus Acidiferrales bacterium]